MTYPTYHEGPTDTLTSEQYLALESINGHILSDFIVPTPDPKVPTRTIHGLRLGGRYEGLALVLAGGQLWECIHIPTGVMLFQAKSSGIEKVLTAIHRTFYDGADWTVPTLRELNAACTDSLRRVRHWLSM